LCLRGSPALILFPARVEIDARGRPVLAAILDECAFYPDLGQDSSDQELYDAIKPGTLRASVRDYSMITGISSPYRRGGLLYKKWSEHYGQLPSGWMESRLRRRSACLGHR
jgi:hypothetical protein